MKIIVVVGVVEAILVILIVSSIIFSPGTCKYETAEYVAVSNAMIGIIFAVTAAITNSVSYLLLKYTLSDTLGTAYCSSWKWWVGFILITIAEVLNSFAYGYAQTVIVASISSITLVFNGVLAVVVARETPSVFTVLGSLCIINGLILLFLLTPVESKVYSVSEVRDIVASSKSVLFLIVSTWVVVVLYYVQSDNILRLSAMATIVSSWGVVCARSLIYYSFAAPIACEQCGCAVIFLDWLLWLLVFIVVLSGVVGGGVIEQWGLRKFSQSSWVPIHFCATTVVFTLVNMFIYDEWIQVPPWQVPGVILGSILTLWGAVLIAS